jgi:hypothetical protein
MKKVLLSMVLALPVLFAAAQSPYSIGLKGGIGIPNLTSGNNNTNEAANGWSSRTGPYFGIVGEYAFTKRWAIQAELNYSSQGGKKDGVQAIPLTEFFNPVPEGYPDYIYANFKTVAKFNYIELPVMAKYSLPFGDKWSVFFNAGPYVGYLVKANYVSSGTSNLYLDKGETQQVPTTIVPQPLSFDNTQDIKSDLKAFNFGVQGGIGAAYNLSCGKIFFSAGGNYGFIPVQKDAANGQNNIGAATMTLGYLYHLK